MFVVDGFLTNNIITNVANKKTIIILRNSTRKFILYIISFIITLIIKVIKTYLCLYSEPISCKLYAVDLPSPFLKDSARL